MLYRLNKKDAFYIVLIVLLSTVLPICYFHLLHYNWNTPLFYSDGDNLSTAITVKRLEGWSNFFTTYQLGAPFVATNYDYPFFTDASHLFFLKIFVNLFNSPGVAINLFYLLLFPLTSVVSYLVMRNMGIHYLFSALGSMVFSFLPYRFLRSTMHLFLSAYTMIPVAVLLLIWLGRDESLLKFQKGFFRYKRNCFAVVSLVLIGWSGIYYAFFMCFFIVVTLLILLFRSKWCWKRLLPGVSMMMVILFSLGLSFIPYFIFHLQHGSNPEIVTRSRLEAEVYGMKITQLFFPNQTHGIPLLEKLQRLYSQAPLPNEGSEYLGVIGILGFFFLLLVLFYPGKENDASFFRLRHLSLLNVSAILLATIGGFGSIFSIFISPQIRGYDRISVFIAYFSILALCMGLSQIPAHIKKPVGKTIFAATLSVLFLISLAEQSIASLGNDAYIQSYESDEHFVKAIESEVGKDGMIYQLPYLAYPESPNQNGMGDYAMGRGFLHSDTLRWSYGDQKGRPSDAWNRALSQEPMNQVIDTISFVGFNGIYIDTYAYTKQELTELTGQIEKDMTVRPLVSEDGRLLFYNMASFNAKHKSQYSDSEWNQIKQRDLSFCYLLGQGFSDTEGKAPGTWNWCGQKGAIEFYNLSEKPIKVRFKSKVYTGFPEKSNLFIHGGGVDETIAISSAGTDIERIFTVQPGQTSVTISTDAPQVVAPNDARSLFMRFESLKISMT